MPIVESQPPGVSWLNSSQPRSRARSLRFPSRPARINALIPTRAACHLFGSIFTTRDKCAAICLGLSRVCSPLTQEFILHDESLSSALVRLLTLPERARQTSPGHSPWESNRRGLFGHGAHGSARAHRGSLPIICAEFLNLAGSKFHKFWNDSGFQRLYR